MFFDRRTLAILTLAALAVPAALGQDGETAAPHPTPVQPEPEDEAGAEADEESREAA